jgi:hypothetical protein
MALGRQRISRPWTNQCFKGADSGIQSGSGATGTRMGLKKMARKHIGSVVKAFEVDVVAWSSLAC